MNQSKSLLNSKITIFLAFIVGIISFSANAGRFTSYPSSTVTDASFSLTWTTESDTQHPGLLQSFEVLENKLGSAENIVIATSGSSFSFSGKESGTYTYILHTSRRYYNTQKEEWQDVEYNDGIIEVVVDNVITSPILSISPSGTTNNGAFTVSWTSSSNANKYILREKINGASSWTDIQMEMALSKSYSGLNTSSRRSYQVRACLNSECSDSSIKNINVAYQPDFTYSDSTHNHITGDFDGNGDLDFYHQPKTSGVKGGVLPQDLTAPINTNLYKSWTTTHPNISAIDDWSEENYQAFSGNFNANPGDELLLLGNRDIVLIHGDIITPITIFPKVNNAIVSWNSSGVASHSEFKFDANPADYVVHVGNLDSDGYDEIFLQARTKGGTSYILDNNGSLIQTITNGFLNAEWSAQSYFASVSSGNIQLTALTAADDDNATNHSASGEVSSLQTVITKPTLTLTSQRYVFVGKEFSLTPSHSTSANSASFSFSGKPSWLSVFDSTTGELRGTPSSSDANRTHNITFTLTENKSHTVAVSKSVVIEVVDIFSIVQTDYSVYKNSNGVIYLASSNGIDYYKIVEDHGQQVIVKISKTEFDAAPKILQSDYSVELIDLDMDGYVDLVLENDTLENRVFISNVDSSYHEVLVGQDAPDALTASSLSEQTELCNLPNVTDCVTPDNINPSDETLSDEKLIPLIPGQLNVNKMGIANYSVSLKAPQGIKGVLPQLSINYNHQGGNGFLGQGWQLGGISEISRCKKNWITDGELSGINDEHDYALCYNGTRMLPIGNGRYQLASENQTLIVAENDGKNPSSFTVYHSDGSRSVYGEGDAYWAGENRTDAFSWRINKVIDIFGNFMTFNYQNNPAAGVFRIKSIDYGNGIGADLTLSVDFETETRSDAKVAYVAGVKQTLDKRLSAVVFKAGTSEVRRYEFSYAENSFAPGKESYLEEIKLCHYGQSLECQKTRFDWTSVSQADYTGTTKVTNSGSWGKDDLLIDINRDGLVDIVRTADTTSDAGRRISEILIANKSGNSISYSSSETTGQWKPHGMPTEQYGFYYNQVRDINGDGFPDLVSLQDNAPSDAWDTNSESELNVRGFHVAYSNQVDGFYETAPLRIEAMNLFGYRNVNPEDRSLDFMDINSDGLTDIFRSGETWFPCNVNHAENQCDFAWSVALDAIQIFHQTYATDSEDPVYGFYAHAEGAKGIFGPLDQGPSDRPEEPLWRGHQSYADLDNDGYIDVIKKGDRSSNGESPHGGFSPLKVTYWGKNLQARRYDAHWSDAPLALQSTHTNNNCRQRYTGDVNGDGLTDIVANCKPGYIAIINAGDKGTPRNEWWDSSTAESQGDHDYYFDGDDSPQTQLLDLNGDGLSDIVSWTSNCSTNYPFYCTGSVYVEFSNGQSFEPKRDWLGQTIITGYKKTVGNTQLVVGSPQFVDIDGDGRIDVAPAATPAGNNSVFLNKVKPRRVEQIKQYFGTDSSEYIKTEIQYSNLSDTNSNVYSPEGDDAIHSYQYHTQFASNGVREHLNPSVQVPIAKFVVEAVKNENSLGGQNSTTYQYAGLRRHRLYGSLGFAKVVQTNSLGYAVETHYSQNFENRLVGSVTRVKKYAPNGELINEEENQYAVECLNGSTLSDCFRDDVALAVYQNGDAEKAPQIRQSLFSQQSRSWTVNSDGSRTLVGATRTSFDTNETLTCPAQEWSAIGSVVKYTTANPRGNHDGYGRSLQKQTITCDLINAGTYSLSTIDLEFESHSQMSSVPVWLNGLNTLKTTTNRGYQQDLGFSKAIEERSLTLKNTFYQGVFGSQTPKGAVESTTEAFGEPLAITTTLTYDVRGEVNSRTKSWANSAPANGGMNGLTSIENSITTSYVSGINGYKQEVVNQGGRITTVRKELVFGQSIYLKNNLGIETEFELDNFGNPYQSTVSNENNGSNKQLQMIGGQYLCANCDQASLYEAVSYSYSKSDGQAPVRVYANKLGQKVASRAIGLNGDAIWSFTRYDAFGRKIATSQPWNESEGGVVHFTEFQFDTEGRVIKETQPITGLSKVNSYNGLTVTGTNELLQTQTTRKNALGWLISSADEAGSKVIYHYNAFGKLKETHMLSISGGDPVVTTIGYNALGQRTSLNDPSTGFWVYRYNALGVIYSQTDATNNTISMEFNQFGEMTKRFDNGVQSGQWKINAQGQLTEVRVDQGSNASQSYREEIAYDVWGLPTVKTTHIAGASSLTHEIYYDDFNRPYAEAYPELPGSIGRLVTQSKYNKFGAVEEISNAVSNAVYWKAGNLDEQGNISSSYLGNGTISFFERDIYGRTTGLLINARYLPSDNSGSNVLFDQSFSYNALGNLEERHDNVLSVQENFAYDNLNRLTHANIGSGIGNQIFDYDGLGNLTDKEDKQLFYGENGNSPHAVSRVVENGETSLYHYDASGNITSVTSGGSTVSENGWTAFGKPHYMRKEGFNRISYSPDRNRYKRVDESQDGTLRTTYSLGKLFEMVVHSNKATEYRHYIGSTVVMTYSDDASQAKLTYQHSDHIGSLIGEIEVIEGQMGISDSQIHRYRFDAWGKKVNPDGTPLTGSARNFNGNRGFTGHEMLEESGLVHMNGRVYDPEIGRFLSPDPLVQAPDFTQSFNRYTYVWNNPLSLTDPTGYSAEAAKYEPQEGDIYLENLGTGGRFVYRDGQLYELQDADGNQIGTGSNSVKETAKETNKETGTTKQGGGESGKGESGGGTSQGSGGNSQLVDSGSNRLKEIYEVLENAAIELGGQLTEMAENIDKTSPEFVEGMADGVASIPRGISRSYIITADMLGLNGEENQKLFEMRTFAFDYVSNEVLREIYHSDEPTSKTLDFVYKHHKLLTSALGKAPIEKRAYILGRFVGRAGVLSKMKSTPAWGVKLGDFYWGVVRSNIGPARVVEQHLFGDTIENMGVDLRGR